MDLIVDLVARAMQARGLIESSVKKAG